jgi:exosortase B
MPSTITLNRTHGIVLAASAAALLLPTYAELDRTVWTVVGQGHGPVFLALVMWLAWQRIPAFLNLTDTKPVPITAGALMAIGLLLYVAGHPQKVLAIETLAQIPIAMAICLALRGWQGLKVMWFPIFFLVFLIPIPGSIVDQITGPMKMGVSVVAEWVLHNADYPVGRSGVMITIGQYNLLVADACAGINSIFALEAVGVFYLSLLTEARMGRKLALAALIIPISFVANVFRVCALILVTYYFGDEVAQGFIHNFAGIFLFTVATALVIGTDMVICKITNKQN